MGVEAKRLGEQFRKRLITFRPPMDKKYAVTPQKRFRLAKDKSLAREEDEKQCLASAITGISRS